MCPSAFMVANATSPLDVVMVVSVSAPCLRDRDMLGPELSMTECLLISGLGKLVHKTPNNCFRQQRDDGSKFESRHTMTPSCDHDVTQLILVGYSLPAATYISSFFFQ